MDRSVPKAIGSLHEVAASSYSLLRFWRHGLRVLVLFGIRHEAVPLSWSFRSEPWAVLCIKRRLFSQCNQRSRTHPSGSTSPQRGSKPCHSITLSGVVLPRCNECHPSTDAAAGRPFSSLPQPAPSWGRHAGSAPVPSSSAAIGLTKWSTGSSPLRKGNVAPSRPPVC